MGLISNRWILVAGVGCSFFLPGCSPGEDDPSTSDSRSPNEAVVEAYFAAANAHDLNRMEGMFTPGAEWYLLGNVLQGREEILAPHEQDIATNTRLAVRDLRSSADTVWVELTEWNDFLTEFGVDSLNHRVRIVLEDGLIYRMEPVDQADPFGGALDPFFGWVATEKPEAWAVLVDESGRPTYGERSGELLVELAREWRGR